MTPLRRSLFYPANAIPDPGIDLRRAGDVVAYRPRDITRVWPGNLTGEFWLSEEPAMAVAKVGFRVKDSASEFGLTMHQLVVRRRTHPLVLYRQAIMALACHLTTRSLPDIGRMMGGYDHTTIVHARARMAPHIEAISAQMAPDTPPIEWARAMKRRLDETMMSKAGKLRQNRASKGNGDGIE